MWIALGTLYLVIGLSFAWGNWRAARRYDKPPWWQTLVCVFLWPIFLPIIAAG